MSDEEISAGVSGVDYIQKELKKLPPKKKKIARRKVKEIKLSDEQKMIVLAEIERDTDLMRITRILFGNVSQDGQVIDGRSKEGRAVRKFVAQRNLKSPRTTSYTKIEPVLDDEQQAFILSPDNVEKGMSLIEIARIVFKDKDIKPLSKEHKLVTDYIREHRPDVSDDEITLADTKYVPPRSFSRVLKKVNMYCDKNYDPITMPAKQKKWIEGLQSHLMSPFFISSINQLKTVADRALFEGEFVRAIWDKPELSPSELNSYVMVCTNYIRIKHIQSRMNVLNSYLDDTHGEDPQITMKLTELIKGTSTELDSCEKRVESVLRKMEGERSKRMEKKGQENGSILALVEAFQLEEERNRMVQMAEMKNKLIEEEVDRLESLDEFKARVMGISKDELL
jgi:hypothetical protein